MNEEIKMYEKQGNWDFSDIQCFKEYQDYWIMHDEVEKYSTENSLILDLGTAGGEKIFSQMPKNVGLIIGTDLSNKMIETAKKNSKEYPKVKVKFAVMDNLKIEFPNGLFDIVTARHTIINAKEIYRVLNDKGVLIVRGVDKYDCWEIKKLFGRGQAYNDDIAISDKDYKDIKNAGFKDVKMTRINANEYFETAEDLLKLLLKTPILDDFSEIRKCENIHRQSIEKELFDEYIKNNTSSKGILLKRRYYGIVAKK